MPKGGPNMSSKPAVGKEDAKGEGAEKKELVFSSRYKEVITLPSEAHRWDNRYSSKQMYYCTCEYSHIYIYIHTYIFIYICTCPSHTTSFLCAFAASA